MSEVPLDPLKGLKFVLNCAVDVEAKAKRIDTFLNAHPCDSFSLLEELCKAGAVAEAEVHTILDWIAAKSTTESSTPAAAAAPAAAPDDLGFENPYGGGVPRGNTSQWFSTGAGSGKGQGNGQTAAQARAKRSRLTQPYVKPAAHRARGQGPAQSNDKDKGGPMDSMNASAFQALDEEAKTSLQKAQVHNPYLATPTLTHIT
jgi:hypothetical protein